MIAMSVNLIMATYGGLGRHVIFAKNLDLFAKVILSALFFGY